MFYRCDQNLVPEEEMTSVCTVDGWSPNPGVLVCNVGTYVAVTEDCSWQVMHIIITKDTNIIEERDSGH